MKAVVAFNILLAMLAALLPNEFLVWQSYMLFGVQAVVLLGYLIRRIDQLKEFFLPSLFVLIYFLVNLTLGSFLVPREYGWNKEFAITLEYVTHYQLIIPYFLLSNTALFVLSAIGLKMMKAVNAQKGDADRLPRDGLEIPKAAVYYIAFFILSYYDVMNAYSMQLGIMTVHITGMVLRRSPLRYILYLMYFGTLVTFNFDNKREFAMALFLVIFLEAYVSRIPVRFKMKTAAAYTMAIILFSFAIISSSILRGYGDYPVSSPIDAVLYIPDYVTSEIFIDGITDNLELNYNYGVAVASIDTVLEGRIDYQFGLSFAKILFLPVPRDVYPNKPESVMQIFTKEYAPDWWAVGGSMPVMFASEMFINFHVLGLLAFSLVWYLLNRFYMAWHVIDKRSFRAHSYMMLVITILLLARGSGVEQYFLYYLFAVPVLLFHALVRGGRATEVRTRQTSRAQPAVPGPGSSVPLELR